MCLRCAMALKYVTFVMKESPENCGSHWEWYLYQGVTTQFPVTDGNEMSHQSDI